MTLLELTELFNTGGIEAIHAHLLTHTRPDMGAVVEAKNELGDALDGMADGKDDPIFVAFCKLEKAIAALKAGGGA